MSPQFWLTQYFRKTNNLNKKYAILIFNQKNYQLSINILRSRMFFQMLKMVAQIHCINFKPTKRNPQTSIKALQVQPIAQVAFDCILSAKPSLTLPCLVPS